MIEKMRFTYHYPMTYVMTKNFIHKFTITYWISAGLMLKETN